MTYALKTTSLPYIQNPAFMILARAAITAKRSATAILRSLIALPSAIGAVFAMTYVAPYQSGQQHKDHSDPRNF